MPLDVLPADTKEFDIEIARLPEAPTEPDLTHYFSLIKSGLPGVEKVEAYVTDRNVPLSERWKMVIDSISEYKSTPAPAELLGSISTTTSKEKAQAMLFPLQRGLMPWVRKFLDAAGPFRLVCRVRQISNSMISDPLQATDANLSFLRILLDCIYAIMNVGMGFRAIQELANNVAIDAVTAALVPGDYRITATIFRICTVYILATENADAIFTRLTASAHSHHLASPFHLIADAALCGDPACRTVAITLVRALIGMIGSSMRRISMRSELFRAGFGEALKPRPTDSEDTRKHIRLFIDENQDESAEVRLIFGRPNPAVNPSEHIALDLLHHTAGPNVAAFLMEVIWVKYKRPMLPSIFLQCSLINVTTCSVLLKRCTAF